MKKTAVYYDFMTNDYYFGSFSKAKCDNLYDVCDEVIDDFYYNSVSSTSRDYLLYRGNNCYYIVVVLDGLSNHDFSENLECDVPSKLFKIDNNFNLVDCDVDEYYTFTIAEHDNDNYIGRY